VVSVGILEDGEVVLEFNKDRGLVEAVKRGGASDNPLKTRGERGFYDLSGHEADLGDRRGEDRGTSHCVTSEQPTKATTQNES
jgi:hypothetical protein